MKKVIILLGISLMFVGCSKKEPELNSKNSFKYPTGQKYKDISYQKGFDLPYEYHQG